MVTFCGYNESMTSTEAPKISTAGDVIVSNEPDAETGLAHVCRQQKTAGVARQRVSDVGIPAEKAGDGCNYGYIQEMLPLSCAVLEEQPVASIYYTHETVPVPRGVERACVGRGFPPNEHLVSCPLPFDPILPRSAIEALDAITSQPACWGYVYFVEAEGLKRIKIGRSWRSPERRRAGGMQTGCPARLVIVRSIYGHGGNEKELHSAFSQEHISGEWFHFSKRIQRFVAITRWLDTRLIERTCGPYYIVPSDESAYTNSELPVRTLCAEAFETTGYAAIHGRRYVDMLLREGSAEQRKQVKSMLKRKPVGVGQ